MVYIKRLDSSALFVPGTNVCWSWNVRQSFSVTFELEIANCKKRKSVRLFRIV